MDILDATILKVSQNALNFARHLTKCPSTQDELYQLGMIQIFKVWEHFPDYPDARKVKVAQAAYRNIMLDYFKHETANWEAVNNWRVIHVPYHRQGKKLVADAPTDGPGDDSNAGQLEERVKGIVAGLPEILQKIHAMKSAGASKDQIGKELGLKDRRVRAYIYRLRDELKRGLLSSQEK